MSTIFRDRIKKAFDPLIRRTEPKIDGYVARINETDKIKVLVARAAGRAVERFAAEELGVAPPLRFPDEFAFFDDYLRPAYEIGSLSQDEGWCSQWWRHRSVVFRIRAMWRDYEHRSQVSPATADEEFLRLVGDHHMSRLLGSNSPMKTCRPQNHEDSTPLASAPLDIP